MEMTQIQTINGIRTIIENDAQHAANCVANLIASLVREKPQCNLGLATGSTPVHTYERLVEMFRNGEVDFSGVTTFNLDEYIGLAEDHPQSYRSYMSDQLFKHLNIPLNQTHIPNGCAEDITEHCQVYESLIHDSGGIDLQLLGIGHNGHIAFNEPGSPATSRTRQVDLTADTIEKNARFFDSINDVPRHAITMGIATIMEADQIVLLATGKGKAKAVQEMLEGPVTEAHPASLLRQHPDVTVVIDREASQSESE